MVKTKKRRGRPPNPERRAEQRRLAKQASVALFLKHGLDSVTIDQIVDRLGWAKGSFYRSFKNKEALVRWAYEPLASHMREAFRRLGDSLDPPGSPEEVRRAYDLFATHMGIVLLQDEEIARLYLQERRGPNVGARRPIIALATLIEKEAIRTAIRARSLGVIKKGDPTLIALTLIGAVEHVLDAFLGGRIEASAASVAAGLAELLVNGVVFAD